VSAEAEESPLLKTVTGKRLVKTLQARKDLVCALVICKLWRSAMVLCLIVVTSRVLKW
jgi:hypothetical protein